MKKKVDMKRKIAREVRMAIRGTGKVKITFKKDAVDALDQLCKLERKGAIMLNDCCAAILSAAKQKRYWGHTLNRIVLVGLGINFNEKEFLDLSGAIENIEAVKKVKIKN